MGRRRGDAPPPRDERRDMEHCIICDRLTWPVSTTTECAECIAAIVAETEEV
jgi:hypothetical protein